MCIGKRIKRLDESTNTAKRWGIFWWLRRFSESLLAVFCGWILAGLIWDVDELTGPAIAGVSLVSVGVYVFFMRRVIFGNKVDEIEDGY